LEISPIHVSYKGLEKIIFDLEDRRGLGVSKASTKSRLREQLSGVNVKTGLPTVDDLGPRFVFSINDLLEAWTPLVGKDRRRRTLVPALCLPVEIFDCSDKEKIGEMEAADAGY
jgi:hypothetical protein